MFLSFPLFFSYLSIFLFLLLSLSFSLSLSVVILTPSILLPFYPFYFSFSIFLFLSMYSLSPSLFPLLPLSSLAFAILYNTSYSRHSINSFTSPLQVPSSCEHSEAAHN
uniref:Uncharacterized protein n=1 Tax=Rhipicephalus microplus TaxID=6941 RepID=A0A6M2CM51_RHIMP